MPTSFRQGRFKKEKKEKKTTHMWPTPHLFAVACCSLPTSLQPHYTACSAGQTPSSSRCALQLPLRYSIQLTSTVIFHRGIHWCPQFRYFTTSSHAVREARPEVWTDSLLSHKCAATRAKPCHYCCAHGGRRDRWESLSSPNAATNALGRSSTYSSSGTTPKSVLEWKKLSTSREKRQSKRSKNNAGCKQEACFWNCFWTM